MTAVTIPVAAPPGWRDARRILAVRLDTLGDVLMATPAIRALRRGGPDRSVTLLTSRAGAAAGRLVPEIDEVVVYEAPWMKASRPRADAAADLEVVTWLHQQAFDAAVIFTTYSQSSLPAATICHLAEVPLRLAHCRENPYQLLTDWRRETEPETEIRHEVRRQLDLVASVGATTDDERLSITIPEPAARRAERLLETADIPLHGRWLVVHAGASAPSRRYEHFAEVARRLANDLGYVVVLTGTDEERELVEGIRVAVGPGAVSLAGRLDLATLAAVIRLSSVLVSNNSGPVHVAAAVGTPVVDLYALTNPQHQPWMVPSIVLSHDVPCRNCYRSVCPMGHHNCLRLVDPGAVVAAVEELAEGGRHGVVARVTPGTTRIGVHS